MSELTKKFRLGAISGAEFTSDYNGQTSKQYSFQKSFKKKDSETWENTQYFYDSELPKLHALIGSIIDRGVVVSDPKPKAPEAPPPVYDEAAGF